MRKEITWENLVELIEEDKFGYYSLKEYTSNYLISGSTTNGDAEANTSMAPAKIIEKLTSVLSKYGAGRYVISLKKSPSTPSSGQVVHLFSFGDLLGEESVLGAQNHMSGLSLVDMDSRIQVAVRDAVENERKISEQERLNERLRLEIEELKKGSEKKQMYDAISDLGKIVAVGVIAKVAPEAMATINKIFGDLPDDENDDPNKLK